MLKAYLPVVRELLCAALLAAGLTALLFIACAYGG